MKNAILLLVLMVLKINLNSVSAQQALFKDQAKDAVVQNSSRMSGNEYVPGELIVKFKDNLSVKSTGAKFKSASTVTDALQTKYNVQKAEALFPKETRLKSVQILTAPNGEKFIRPSLHNIYKLKIADESQLMNAIRDFKADTANVVYAEPNYIISICNDKPIGPILTEADVQKMQQGKTDPSFKDNPIVNDPMYSQQWYIPAVMADQVWTQTKGDATQIIAILDTGVDWLHPDLKNKIWNNPNPSTNSYPDGIVNDICGWDFVNNDNNPMDDNSHGTHVAGIAAAETNNGVGIAGICPNARIMPVKVFQSSGYGDNATIVKGINYAATHGATVINMSFGSYSRSMAMEDALANAYASCVLVASAGNDGYDIEERNPPHIAYPASFSFVLGVQATQQDVNHSDNKFKSGKYLADFSNYDSNGPTFSTYLQLFNYELEAPGTNILSTVPNGGYRIFQGTSMAAPVVSGCVALFRSKRPDDSQELMWAKFIQSTSSNLNIYEALNKIPVPQLQVISQNIIDTLAGDDRDGKVDVGETIQYWITARNTGAQCDTAFLKLRFNEFEDKSTAQIIQPTSFIGSISPFASRTNQFNPIKLKVSPNVTNGRAIVFDLLMWYKGAADTTTQKIVINAVNGSEISGVVDTTMILTPDKIWIVNSSFRIGVNGNLIIKPGTQLKLDNEIVNRGKLTAIGKPDSLIYITGPQSYGGGGSFTFKYCTISDIYKTLGDPGQSYGDRGNYIYENCVFDGVSVSNINQDNAVLFYAGSLIMKESVIKNCAAIYGIFETTNGYQLFRNNFSNNLLCTMVTGYLKNRPIESFGLLKYNNFINFDFATVDPHPTRGDAAFSMSTNSTTSQIKNNFIGFGNNREALITTGSSEVVSFKNQYWGSLDTKKIKSSFFDFWQDPTKPMIDYKPFLTAPFDSCHAITWKVLVNGKDAQDEFVDPVGIGPQRFDVYFNKPMDVSVTPQVSFGVTYPYTQQAVSDSGRWNSDHTIWTVYKTVKLLTGDGINHLRVAGATDLENWEIPVEDRRFNFLIDAATSSSMDFIAKPGLGKVNLEWNNTGVNDLMGFNMYRMENINDTTLSKPLKLNTLPIPDTLYTDFTGTPNKKYYYFYKVVRTDMSETDSSRVVTATPFTASKGDANGDLTVNVLDITSIVTYLLGQNPTPFIFEAADVNGDNVIDVLDVVADANIIKGNKSSPIDEGKNYNPKLAYINLKPEIIQLKSDAQVQAIQFELQGNDLEKIKLSPIIKGFEMSYAINGNKIKGVLFNLSGQTIPAGISDILKIETGSGKLTWGDVFGADPQGRYVTIMKNEDVSLTTPTSPFGLSVQPNPSGSDMQIGFSLPEKAFVTVKVYNVMGALVSQLIDNTLQPGNQQLIWNGTNGNNEVVKPGVYFIRVEARNEKNQTLKEQMKVVRL